MIAAALRVVTDVKLSETTITLRCFSATRDDAIAMTITDEQLLALILQQLEAQISPDPPRYLLINIAGLAGQLSILLRLLNSKGYIAALKDGEFLVQLPCAARASSHHPVEKELHALSMVTRHASGLREARLLHESRQVAMSIMDANSADHELLVALRIGLKESCQLFSDAILKKKYGLRFDFCYQLVGFERVSSLLQARGYQVTLHPPRLVEILCFRNMQSLSVVEYENKIIYKID